MRFLEKPKLEILKFGVDLIVDRLRATNQSLFFKTEKFENFFFKKISKSKISKIFKKKFSNFSVFKKRL